MNTCGACLYFGEHPAMPGSKEVGLCYGMPPATLLLPGQAVRAGIVKPGEQRMELALQSVRSPIQATDRGCSLFKPI